jgi:hypothetical protein
LKLAGQVAWFDAKRLRGVRLFGFTHFPGKANQTCYAVQSDSVRSAQLLVYAQFFRGEFIVVPLQ